MAPKEQESKIDESTKVPLGIAVVAVIFFCTLALWAGRVEWNTSANAEQVKEVKAAQVGYADDIATVKSDLKLIKSKLGITD